MSQHKKQNGFMHLRILAVPALGDWTCVCLHTHVDSFSERKPILSKSQVLSDDCHRSPIKKPDLFAVLGLWVSSLQTPQDESNQRRGAWRPDLHG